MSVKKNFNVKINKTEVVAAVLPMQEHLLPLSNLDLLLPPVGVGVFFCYQSNPVKEITKLDFGLVVKILKASLAEALVSYYAFAGEIVHNLAGEPEILCNNRGVDFTEAFADVELKEINFYNADESIEGKLIPNKKHGVLAVQITNVTCGGIVVGCTFDHRVADGYSSNMFLVSWSELARSKPLSQLPSFQRSFLLPRNPGYYDDSMDNLYVPISTLLPIKPDTVSSNDQAKSRIYYVTGDKVVHLQSLANIHDQNQKSTMMPKSKIESFSAFLWKTIASGINETSNFKDFRFGVVIDGRTRLSNEDNVHDHLLKRYFGNVLSIPFGMKRVEELKEKPLNWAANEVHELIKSAVRREHFLGLIDWVEAHRPEPAIAKIYATGEDGPAVVVSSGLRFQARKVNFGFGEPVFGSYHFPWATKTGYVMPMPSPKGNGDWIVYMNLVKCQLEVIEDFASDVFKPVNANYLNLI